MLKQNRFPYGIGVVLWIVLCLWQVNSVQAQDSEIGFWVGSGTYIGDLNPNNNLMQTRPAGGILYRYTFNPYVAVKGTASYAFLQHADSISSNPFPLMRNLSFKTGVIEVSGQVELNFRKFIAGHKKHYFTPYITAGIGLFHFSPKATLNDETFSLRTLGTEGQFNSDFTGRKPYKSIQVAIPVGVGIKYWMRKEWSFFVEVGYRSTSTDYLDDVSSEYIDPFLIGGANSTTGLLSDRSGEVNPEPLGVEGKQRGDSTNNDGYLLLNIGLTYTIFNRKCIQ